MKIVVVNGPNLNRLGKRQPEIYGTTTLADIEKLVRSHADAAGIELDFVQSNHEGVLLDTVHAAADEGVAVIINPGAFTHTSVALRDALAEIADGKGLWKFTSPMCTRARSSASTLSFLTRPSVLSLAWVFMATLRRWDISLKTWHQRTPRLVSLDSIRI